MNWKIAILCCAGAATALAQTEAQSSAGRAAYLAHCAGCHLPDLAGRNEAPQLSGTNFMTTWRPRNVGALVSLMQTTMPPGNIGGLGADAYVQLAAFIVEANGGRTGSQPLTAALPAAIRAFSLLDIKTFPVK